jgi:hypothetical protein
MHMTSREQNRRYHQICSVLPNDVVKTDGNKRTITITKETLTAVREILPDVLPHEIQEALSWKSSRERRRQLAG